MPAIFLAYIFPVFSYISVRLLFRRKVDTGQIQDHFGSFSDFGFEGDGMGQALQNLFTEI